LIDTKDNHRRGGEEKDMFLKRGRRKKEELKREPLIVDFHTETSARKGKQKADL